MEPPSSDIVVAFGGEPGTVTRVDGGSGTTWRAGSIALKPDGDPPYVAWIAQVVAAIQGEGRFRVATPRQASGGSWVVDGWWAMEWLDGIHVRDAWDRAIDVSNAFHKAIADARLAAPSFVREPTNPWRLGDAVAWREMPIDRAWPASVITMLDRLSPHLDQAWTGGPVQPVHVDIGGNILFADEAGLPPAVIDLSMHVRPSAYANAVLVADAVAWDGAPSSLAIGYLARTLDGDQLLARAIAFRVAAAAALWPDHPARADTEVDGYAPLVSFLRS